MVNILSTVRKWIGHDPDPADREELEGLVRAAESDDSDARMELERRFDGQLTFGTAGLRGQMGAGPQRMNTAVVTTATAGLCTVLATDLPEGFHVVIGFDARHRSNSFAETAAAVVVAAGGRASLMPRELPTPMLAFAVQHLDADAGIMVTASHNPAADNGYKVYTGSRISDAGGAQIVPPMDKRIFDAILATGPANEVPSADEGWDIIEESLIDDYVTEASGLVSEPGDKDLNIVMTAMHGVGATTAAAAFSAAGFKNVTLVPEQEEANPDFPTVAFPNPEEDGALDLSIAQAKRSDADIIVALDPDADRCSIAIPDPSSNSGWRQLTGDQVGALLGDSMASKHEGHPDAVVARSIVSSSLLSAIADAHGVTAEETLTGFKWISRAQGLVFGYEEAIGYCVNPDKVRDKDGITAGIVACDLAMHLRASGRSLDDRLDELALKHGLHVTAPLTFRVNDLSLITEGMSRLRANPPEMLAGAPITEWDDLADGWNGLPPTEGVRMVTDQADRVIVRPSGTEPKLKCYLQVVMPVEDVSALPQARRDADDRLSQIKTDLKTVLQL